jgi:hypothetical protein
MNYSPGQSLCRELELLHYRHERIEELLAEEIVSAEMEATLRQKLKVLQQQIQSLRGSPLRPPSRLAA